jgi:dGTPase
VAKIYRSTEVTDKEIAGFKILETLLDVHTISVENLYNHQTNQYDGLILKNLKVDLNDKNTMYQNLMEVCNYISRLTDGNAMLIFQKINGNL